MRRGVQRRQEQRRGEESPHLAPQVARMREVGNINAKLKYEQWVPPSYRRVDSATPQVFIALLVF